MEDKWKRLGRFLRYVRESQPGLRVPDFVRVRGRRSLDEPYKNDFPTEDLETGKPPDLKPLLRRAAPERDLLAAIARAYYVDQYLLDPYGSMEVAGPVVVPPRTNRRDAHSRFHVRRAGSGCYYYSPHMHLAGSRLYPVLFTLKGRNSHTPWHSHPGTEVLIVIQGQARAEISSQPRARAEPGCPRIPYDLHEGDVLHFSSEHEHTIYNTSNERFCAWAFRELTSPSKDSPYAVLGRQLQSWRLCNRERLDAIAERSGLALKDLYAFERDGPLPFPRRTSPSPTRDGLCTLARAYQVGVELLVPFRKRARANAVHASPARLAPPWPERRRVDDRTSLEARCRAVWRRRVQGGQHLQRAPGARYYWPSEILRDSLIRPGLISVAASCWTPAHRHPGSEIVLVIEGKAEIHFPDNHTKIAKLERGYAAHFDSDWNHTIVNVGEQVLKTWVLRDYRLTH